MLTWGLKFEHWWGAGGSELIASRVAEILNRPCFADATVVGCSYAWNDDEIGPETEKTVESVRAALRNPRTDFVTLRNGAYSPETSRMHIETGRVRWQRVPLKTRIAVPFPDDPTELEAAACDLAGAHLMSLGYLSVWPNLDQAMKFSHGIREDKARAMGISKRRQMEWNLHVGNVDIDAEVAGPEWGVFLSPGHLAKLPAAAIRATGAFAEVRELESDRVFLRLTDDPRDALAPDYESRLDKAREALRPILADLARLD